MLLGMDSKLKADDQREAIDLSIWKDNDASTSNGQASTYKRPRSPSGDANGDSKRTKLSKEGGTCTAPPLRTNMMATNVFLTEGWQDKWCRCDKVRDLTKRDQANADRRRQCLPLYSKMPYLLYEETVYEPPADPDAGKSLDELGTAALMQMPREQAIRSVEAYQGLRNKLKAFLQPFAAEGKVVGEADIKQFFEDQKNA